MASLARTIQKRILRKKGIAPVPVYRLKPGTKKPTIVGHRLPLCPKHIGYDADTGLAHLAPTKRVRKPPHQEDGGMIRQHIGKSVERIRREQPDAAIIRFVERGKFVSFDSTDEAMGHPTTRTQVVA